MDGAQRQYLEKRYRFRDWQAKAGRTRNVIKELTIDGTEIRRWRLQRVQRDDQVKPPMIRTMWSHGDSMSELLAVDLFECPSVKSAADQVLVALSNMESNVIERQTGKDAPGDIAFGLNDTMALFARANVVVLVRNAGPDIVPVSGVARELDQLLVRRLKKR